jgi:hypothetical protein
VVEAPARGGLGVPPLRHDLPRWKTAVGVMLVLGVMFPLVGVSMVVMWVVDSLVVRRRRVLARPEIAAGRFRPLHRPLLQACRGTGLDPPKSRLHPKVESICRALNWNARVSLAGYL